VKLAAPLILAAHAAILPTLPGWDRVAVYEGAAIAADDVPEWVTLGYVAGSDGPAVSLEPVPARQSQTREGGTISCQLIVAADDVPAARARVFDLLTAWSAWLAADRTLAAGGQAVLLSTSDLHLAIDVVLATTRAGATANAVVTITYEATTYG
jgi:hypothetical protein